jgi:hypothetical protein
MSPTRTRRREPARRLTAPPDSKQAAFARRLCRDVASIVDDPLTLERWTSGLLGKVWERHRRNPAPLQHDPGFALGAAIVEAIGDVGGLGAKMALLAISKMADPPLSYHAAEWAEHSVAGSVPAWIDHVGSARPCRALSVCSPSDGEVIFLEAEQPAFGLHTVVVYIDYRLEGIAKHVGLILPLDQIDTEMMADPAVDGLHTEARAVEPVFACGRILTALELTDEHPHLPVGETFADLRAIAVARASAWVMQLR